MSSHAEKQLDEALAGVSRDATASKDLWPAIRASIAADSRATKMTNDRSRSRWLGGWGQLAAGVALIVVTSVTTYVITRQAVRNDIYANGFMSTNFDASTLGADYLRARADLDRLFAERIASLPPETRTKLENNLADLRRAADEIAGTLAEHPSDPLLQELLISTRRRELQLLADVSRMPLPNS